MHSGWQQFELECVAASMPFFCCCFLLLEQRLLSKVYSRCVQWNCGGFQYRLARILEEEKEATETESIAKWVFEKIGKHPKMDGLQWKTQLKWVIWGYHHFRKHPNWRWFTCIHLGQLNHMNLMDRQRWIFLEFGHQNSHFAPCQPCSREAQFFLEAVCSWLY